MSRTTIWFIIGAILSPLVLTFGKLIVFIVGIVGIVWIATTVHELMKEDDDADGNPTGS